MGHQNKTNKELIKETSRLHQQITKLKLSENKNKQKLKEIKTLIDELPQAVYEIDKKGYFTFLNQTALKIWGITKNDLKNGLSSLQTLIPEDRPRAINNINKLFSGSKLVVNEYTTIKKEGTTFPILIYGSPKYKNGEIVGTRGMVIDISKLKNIEKTLLKSQQEFASLFDSSPIALAYVDEKSNIININPRFTKLFGYTLNEVRERNVDDGIIHPYNRLEEAKRVTKKALKGNFYCETIRKKKDGTLFPVAISGSQVIINGKLQGLMALFQDITERKKNEKVQQVLYNISKAANSNISLKELYPIIHKELHKIIDASNFHISLLRKNKSFFSYYSDEKDSLTQIHKSGTNNNLATYVSKNGKSILVNYKQIMKMVSQGKIKLSQMGTLTKNVLFLGVPLKIKENIIGSMAVLSYTNPNLYSKKDIKLLEFVSEQVATAIERKRTEEALQASQQEFSNLFNSSPEALIYIDEKSKILDINAQFTKLFGYTLEEIKGKNVDDGIIHSQKIIHEGKKLTKKALKGFVNYETIGKRKDGSEFPVFISSATVKINNKLKGIITSYQDITERKKNEKVQQVLYNISKAANSRVSLNQLYKAIHKELGKIIDTTNFYIALLDEKEGKIYFPYHVDEMGDEFEPQNLEYKSLTCYVIRNKRSLLLNYDKIKKLNEKGELLNPGVITKDIFWFGVPLKVEGKVIGAMAVQNYSNPKFYSEKDVGLLEFVSEQVATAIERKRTEEALQASQQEFSNLFNSSPEAAVYHDEKGVILNINPRFTELFGYTLEEIKGKNINEGMIFPQNNTVKESERLTKLALEGKVVTFETIRKKKDSSLISVIISVALVITEGQHRGVIAFYKDITERKKAEEELRQSEEKFVGIFKNIPDAAFYQDREGIILDINPRFTQLFGYTKEDILGKNIDEIGFYPKDRIKEGKDLTRKTLNEDLTNFETVRQKKDGTPVSARISTSFVKIKDKVTGIIALYQDITERKKNEKVQQVLYNISKAANSNISLKELYPIIHKELHKIIDASNFHISLLRKNKSFFSYFSDERDSLTQIHKSGTKNNLAAYVSKNGKSILVNYKQIKEMASQGKIKLSQMGTLSKNLLFLGVPLKIKENIIGSMAVLSYTNPNLYNKKDIKLMKFVSEQVATAIERKRMEEELKKLARHDPLTGTYNRAYGLELIRRQIILAKRNKTSFLLAYTDLDNLKKINDEFGHEEGDKAIVQTANLFQSILREVDIVIRMGGDEFLLVFPESSAEDLSIINKRFKRNLIKLNKNIKKSYKIGFSIGISCYDPDNPQSAEELIRIADEKMYKEKKGKRCK